MAKKERIYKSAKQAVGSGALTPKEWGEVQRTPFAWVVLKSGKRVRWTPNTPNSVEIITGGPAYEYKPRAFPRRGM